MTPSRPSPPPPGRGAIPLRITDHPLWDTLLPFLFLTGHKKPQKGRGGDGRIEVREPSDRSLRSTLLSIEIRCSACKRVINPVRLRQISERQFGSSMFFSPSCEQHVKAGCSRGTAATIETHRLIRLIKGFADPHQRTLFEGDFDGPAGPQD